MDILSLKIFMVYIYHGERKILNYIMHGTHMHIANILKEKKENWQNIVIWMNIGLQIVIKMI